MNDGPAFGQADLTNCERELIHLPGSIQPHGILFLLSEPALEIVGVSDNVEQTLGTRPDDLLGLPLSQLSESIHLQAKGQFEKGVQLEPLPLSGTLSVHGQRIEVDGAIHRSSDGGLIVEFLPRNGSRYGVPILEQDRDSLLTLLADSVAAISETSNVTELSHVAARAFRDLIGYDRVMLYKFDDDGHGQIIGEARDPRLESLLGHRYPASDIPQRARELYISNRVRVLVDARYVPAAIVSLQAGFDAQNIDMSMCYLRSMSPLHLQYLQNMGVTATLVVSLVRHGKLWGLVAAHHDTQRNVSFAIRSAAQLLGEAVCTRLAGIENYAQARVAIQVRRLERRLIESTSSEGDWKLALFRNPNTLLQPLEASGAALFFGGDLQTCGIVPSTPELRALAAWVDSEISDAQFSTNSVAKLNPELRSLVPVACGVLAMKLSTSSPDYLMWFRQEQLQSVTWAGDPNKPVIGNDPKDLSPRRSFAAWSEVVRGTSLPWTSSELLMARAIGNALIDIIVQVHAVQMLIGEHQLETIRSSVSVSKEPVVIFRRDQAFLFCNDAFRDLMGAQGNQLGSMSDLAEKFLNASEAREAFNALGPSNRSWRSELELVGTDEHPTQLRIRADIVPDSKGHPLGYVVSMVDISNRRRAEIAREHLQESLDRAQRQMQEGQEQQPWSIAPPRTDSGLAKAVVANASLAAMDIADAMPDQSVGPSFEEVESSTERINQLEQRIIDSYKTESPSAD